jgi:dimethylargininase
VTSTPTIRTQTLITRQPSDRLGEGALTFMERSILDIDLAAQQHEAYRAAIISAGAALIDLEPEHKFPDATFVEDVLLAFPECYVLCRPGTPTRVDEPLLIASFLPDDRPTIQMKSPATLDGGDVLRIGRTIFVGLSTRTNAYAVASLKENLGIFGYDVVAVRVMGSLHLKTAVTAPMDDLIVVNRAWVDVAPFGSRHVIDVDPDEPFSGNTLKVGEQLFMQIVHQRTAERLKKVGMETAFLDISEFAKVEAGLTCMSVIIPPAK